jgi:hypothetical protein
MRIVEEDGTKRVYFRQSWVNKFQHCPEQARLTDPTVEDGVPSDMAALGTALHSGIEAALRGEALDPREVYERSENTLTMLESQFTYVDVTRADALSYLRAWSRLLLGNDEFNALYESNDARIEEKFAVFVDARMVNGERVEMWWEGRQDAVLPMTYGVDWKTGARTWSEWETTRWNIQSTIYCYAAECEGLLEFPAEFRFVVFTRAAEPKVQVVKVVRTFAHVEWLTERLWRVYDMRTVDRWPLNDQGWWCHPKWCDHFAECKGLYFSDDSWMQIQR